MIASLYNRITRRLSDESGVALVVAMLALLVTSVLAGAAVMVATQTNTFSRQDVNKKNALEAAEAGLQVALYRLNMLRPDSTSCVGDNSSGPDSTGGCMSSVYTLGNGSTYQYYTTPVMNSSYSCVGVTLTVSTGISNRCVTATGTSNGVAARSQVRAAAFAAEPLFPVNGITGLKGINDNNNDYIGGGEASNGPIVANNNVTITGGIELGPNATYTAGTGSSNPTPTTLTQPIVLSPVDPGTSNQSSLNKCPLRAAAGYTTCNDDIRITNGINDPSGNTKPYDQSSGVSFNAATRTLTTSNSQPTLTLGGGIYNFCEVDINNNMTINLAPGTRTEIFIDSPDDPGSGCAAGSGTLNINNNVTWNTLSTDPTALQIYVYGWNNGNNVVTMSNNNVCVCVLYAPQSTIDLSHSSTNSGLTGAVSGAFVDVSNNFAFTYGGNAGTLQAVSTGIYYRSAWAQCTPTWSSSTPGSSCG